MTLTIDELRSRPLDELLSEAWDIRQSHFPNTITFSTPSAKRFISDHHRNDTNAFVNVSVTGNACALDCEHCKATLLESMLPVGSAKELEELADELVAKGCAGVLVSGGANLAGEVPLGSYYGALGYLKEKGLKVLVHTGLATRETAKELKKAEVDQALLDIIGARETIREVYHLDKGPEDFRMSLRALVEEGLDVAPHIVIGLHFGRILGEYEALDIITRSGASNIVLVVLSPKQGTPMENAKTPPPEDIGRLAAIARIMNPDARVLLGCARPAIREKLEMESLALRAGINGMAYPSDATVELAKELDLKTIFRDACCSLM
ncbi:MAG: radical SAM protein [Thermoplasmata archaeon]|nr:radical SAM protein [Thermoplasmata archaeon]